VMSHEGGGDGMAWGFKLDCGGFGFCWDCLTKR
jgi:hypothetical protein